MKEREQLTNLLQSLIKEVGIRQVAATLGISVSTIERWVASSCDRPHIKMVLYCLDTLKSAYCRGKNA